MVIRNSKSKALNPKQYQNPNDQNSKTYSLYRFDVKDSLFIGDILHISSPLTGEDKGEGDVAPHPDLLPRGEKEEHLYLESLFCLEHLNLEIRN